MALNGESGGKVIAGLTGGDGALSWPKDLTCRVGWNTLKPRGGKGGGDTKLWSKLCFLREDRLT